MQRAPSLMVFAFAVLPSCVSMPDPPPPPEDLSALAAQYERPTASVPDDYVELLVEEGQRLSQLGQLLDRLHFVRDAVADTSVGIDQTGYVADFLLQGRIAASVDCPGDETAPLPDGGSNGFLHLLLGVEESRLRRGFSGRVDQCRFLVKSSFAPDQHVVVTADIVGDLGADLGLNAKPADVLIQLTNVTGRAASTLGTLDLARSRYHFRLTRDDALEVLFDPTSIGLPNIGTVVFALRADRAFVLRESRGEWVCGGGGSACALR